MLINLHYFFIDITERNPKKLASVLLETKEAGRRLKGPKPPNIRPSGISSAFDIPVEKLVKISNDYQNYGVMDPKIMRIIFENITTRGYNLSGPTFNILSNALISAQIYIATFHNAQSTLPTSFLQGPTTSPPPPAHTRCWLLVFLSYSRHPPTSSASTIRVPSVD